MSMSLANKSKRLKFRAVLLFAFIFASLVISGCISEPEVCDYDAICTENETDNCADCQDVLGRDVTDPTGNVIYFNDV